MMLGYNFLGAMLAAVIFGGWLHADEVMITAKLSQPVWQSFMRGIGCGVVMYIAVSNYRQHQSIPSVIMGVMLFILAGFEHCIADVFYLATSDRICQGMVFILFVTFGNIVGAQTARRLSEI